jgi:hypothetical protein
MADISGLQIAYNAWRLLQEGDSADPRLPGLKFNTKQLFFLSAAQVNVHDVTHRLSGAMNRKCTSICLIIVWVSNIIRSYTDHMVLFAVWLFSLSHSFRYFFYNFMCGFMVCMLCMLCTLCMVCMLCIFCMVCMLFMLCTLCMVWMLWFCVCFCLVV